MIRPEIKPIVKSHIAAFRSLELANIYADRCVKTHWIVMGDNDGESGEYWVTTPADAQRLERAGYEMV